MVDFTDETPVADGELKADDGLAIEPKVIDGNSPEFAEFLKKSIEHAATVPPMGTVYVHRDGNAIDVCLDTKANYYGEWIAGEGADICLYRDRDTKKIVGAHLPFYMDTIAVDVQDGIKLIARRHDDKLALLREWLNAEISSKPTQPYMGQKTLKKMKELGLIPVEG